MDYTLTEFLKLNCILSTQKEEGGILTCISCILLKVGFIRIGVLVFEGIMLQNIFLRLLKKRDVILVR